MFLFLKIGTTFLFCQHFHFFHDNRVHRSVLEVSSYGTDLPYYIHAFVMKNWLPPVLGPALAMERMPSLSWASPSPNSSLIR